MKAALPDCRADESRVHLVRLPDLANSVLQFNLSDVLQELRNEESWQRETGRSSRTLVKQQDFRITLILMKAGTRMGEHAAQARISIHTLLGRICVHLPEQKLALPAGQLLALDCGIRHDVESLEESAFLLTISWPKEYVTWNTDAEANTHEGNETNAAQSLEDTAI